MPEIGLSGNGAKTGELRAVKFDDIIVSGEFIVERLQFCFFRGIRVIFMVPVQKGKS